MRTRHLVLAATAALAIAATSIGAGIAISGGLSDEARSCGAEGNTILEEFEVDAAKDLWKHLPKMLRAPELETDSRPAHVIVFGGDFDTKGLDLAAPGGKPASFQGVLCVIQADGTVNVYTDVALAGSRWEQR